MRKLSVLLSLSLAIFGLSACSMNLGGPDSGDEIDLTEEARGPDSGEDEDNQGPDSGEEAPPDEPAGPDSGEDEDNQGPDSGDDYDTSIKPGGPDSGEDEDNQGPDSGDEIDTSDEPKSPDSGDEIDPNEPTSPDSGDEISLSDDLKARAVGSCDRIADGSTCVEYIGSYWGQGQNAKMNCADAFKSAACPRPALGGCRMGADTPNEIVTWHYGYGGDPYTTVITYAAQSCRSLPGGQWVE